MGRRINPEFPLSGIREKGFPSLSSDNRISPPPPTDGWKPEEIRKRFGKQPETT